MKSLIITYTILFFFTGISCDHKDFHYSIFFRNNSDKDVYVEWKFEPPDTTIDFDNPAVAGKFYKVQAHAIDNPLYTGATFEDWFAQYDTLMVFVFDAETIVSTPWDTIRANYLVLKRYDLTLDDLTNLNWEITYP